MDSPPPAIGAWKIWQKLALVTAALAAPAVALVIFDVTDAADGSGAVTANVRLIVATAVGLAELALAGLLVWVVSRGYARQADAMLTTFERLAAGETGARAAVVTGDEFGVVAAALNVTLDRQSAGLGRSPDRGPTAEGGANGAAKPREQVQSAAAAIRELAEIADGVTAQIYRASDSAREIQDVARQGARAGQTAAAEVGRARDQMQGAARSVGKLRDSLHDVERVLQSLGDLADETALAALNATIQATNAGDAGCRLAVTTGEVERLAERSAEAVLKSAALVQSMHDEMSNAAAALGDPVADEVTRRAAEVSQALASIGSAAAGLVDASGQAATLAGRQSRAAEVLARTLGQSGQLGQKAAVGANHKAVASTVPDSDADRDNGVPALPASPT